MASNTNSREIKRCLLTILLLLATLELLAAQKSAGVHYADQFGGSDIGAKINSAIRNAIDTGGGNVSTSGLSGSQTSASEIAVGTNAKVPVNLIHYFPSTWTLNPGARNCGVKIFDQSGFNGYSAGGGQGFELIGAAAATMDSLLCSEANPVGGGSYINAENFTAHNTHSSKFSTAALNLRALFDGSRFANIHVLDSVNTGILVHNSCCGASLWNVVANSFGGPGARPYTLGAAGEYTHGINHFGLSLTHPGAGKPALTTTGGKTGNAGNNFFGLYLEHQSGVDTTTESIDHSGRDGLLLSGVGLGDVASSTRYTLKTETGSGPVTALNLFSHISGNFVNDTVRGVTISGAPGSYINYSSAPSYFTDLFVKKGSNPLLPVDNAKFKIRTKLQSLDTGNGFVGTETNHPVQVGSNNIAAVTITTAQKVTVEKGINANGGGVKHKRGVAGCATAASAGATCTTTVTWDTPFADPAYTAVCTGRMVTYGIPLNGGIINQSAASVTFQTVAGTAAAAQHTNIDCIAMHD